MTQIQTKPSGVEQAAKVNPAKVEHVAILDILAPWIDKAAGIRNTDAYVPARKISMRVHPMADRAKFPASSKLTIAEVAAMAEAHKAYILAQAQAECDHTDSLVRSLTPATFANTIVTIQSNSGNFDLTAIQLVARHVGNVGKMSDSAFDKQIADALKDAK